MKTPLLFSLALLCSPLAMNQAAAHCQIPCGIYNDTKVLAELHTDYDTIAKSVAKLAELGKDSAANAVAITRWTMNKEAHAENIIQIAGSYYLAQRVKLPGDEASPEELKDYHMKVSLCHSLIVHAMKAKQNADEKTVETLHDVLHKFMDAFPAKDRGLSK